jgi:hypothetical protein
MQKLRLVLRGWQRRREEKDAQFLAKNVSWGGVPAIPPVSPPSGQARLPVLQIDLEGLQVAYLDDSGRIDYYLDRQTGEVVDARNGESYAEPRYAAVPRRTEASDAADRRAFIETLEASPQRDALAATSDAGEFRRVLSAERKLERGWYVFKNDRATAAIEAWLKR